MHWTTPGVGVMVLATLSSALANDAHLIRSEAVTQMAAAGEPAGAGGPATKVRKGKASYYDRSFAGQRTASGEPYDPRRMTAAHRSLPIGAKARVTNLENGKTVTVTINDRGPHKRGRIIDLSRAAAQRLEMISDGVVDVAIQPLN